MLSQKREINLRVVVVIDKTHGQSIYTNKTFQKYNEKFLLNACTINFFENINGKHHDACKFNVLPRKISERVEA